MAKLNVKPVGTIKTHEGAKAKRINAEQQLRRSLMSCMLWEGEFYEDGVAIAKRITETIPLVEPEKVAAIAIEAREAMKLRHAPLLVVREMARLPKHKALVAATLARVIQRPDELTEFLAIYWKDGKEKLSGQVKKGLAKAFTKFNAYSLAKYNRDGAIKLRDVLFLSHAKPANDEQAAVWKKLIDGKLEAPDTWEVALSAGKGEAKADSWLRLIREEKLGGLAFIRNLRNMREAGVAKKVIADGLKGIDVSRVLPFRFITAANHNPEFEPELESLMFKAVKGGEALKGRTAIAVDCSGSMSAAVSAKSEVTRNDAACAVAILLREMCADGCDVYAFGTSTKQVAARRGFALRDLIKQANVGGSTNLGACVSLINQTGGYDRIVVVTDEQSSDRVSDPKVKGYMINLASARNGVGYGAWKHIDGWSEAVIAYIMELERSEKGE